MGSGFRFPNDSQRIAIVGRTGSGKTQAAAFQLSLRSWDTKPWIVYDFKIDELLNEIKGVRHISTTEVPTQPGLYLVHPQPGEIDLVTQQMWKIWAQENVGVFVDESYMVGSTNVPNEAFRSLLTQGRSKRVPMIVLSQRPCWIDRFVLSESDFFQVFALNDSDDRKTVRRFVPYESEVRLPDYHSWYYDVGRDNLVVLKPVPERGAILDRFAARMEKTKRVHFV